MADRSTGQEAWYAAWAEAYNTVGNAAPEEVAGIRGIGRFLADTSHYNAQYCSIALVQAEQDHYAKANPKSVVHYAEVVRHTSETGNAASDAKFVGNIFQGKDKDGSEVRDRCVCGMTNHQPVNCYVARSILLGKDHKANFSCPPVPA